MKLQPTLAALITFSIAAYSSLLASSNLITFSGGNGTPLVMNFNDSFELSGTVTGGSTAWLVFDSIYAGSIGDGFSTDIPDLIFTIDGVLSSGTVQARFSDWDFSFGEAVAPDIFSVYLGGSFSYTIGTIFSFTGGQSLTTTENWASNPIDYNDYFEIFIMNNNGEIISNRIPVSISIPEFSSFSLMAGAIAFLSAISMTRKRGKG